MTVRQAYGVGPTVSDTSSTTTYPGGGRRIHEDVDDVALIRIELHQVFRVVAKTAREHRIRLDPGADHRLACRVHELPGVSQNIVASDGPTDSAVGRLA